MNISKAINVAKGKQIADLVIKNTKIINVLSEEIYTSDIAISDDIIVGIGTNYKGKKTIDAKGAYSCPGFIDGHVHLESSMVLPSEFAKQVVLSGTTSVITDPHEIANVYGIYGINLIYTLTRNLPISVYFMLPSCVPATPFETSGYNLSAKELSKLIDKPYILGLAEMMNSVGVINLDKTVIDKINLATKHKKLIDGHAPLLTGKDLSAYIVSGVKSDHECTTIEEAKEKLRLGMYLMIREGTAAKNLDTFIPLLKNFNTRKCCFVTDDRQPSQLKQHISEMVQRVIQKGVNPIKAIQCASLNTAEYFGLKNLGAIAPGYKADILIISNLKTFTPTTVIKNGEIIVKQQKLITKQENKCNFKIKKSVNVKNLTLQSFKIKATTDKVKTIKLIPKQLITKSVTSKVKIENGNAISNTENDTLKICVLERHHNTGNIGKGFIKGFNLKSGAIASTVAHDSHNIIVIGTNDTDMFIAVKEIIKFQGGKIVVNNGKVIASLPLPIAGLISTEPINNVIKKYKEVSNATKKLGCKLDDPFMAMGFISLSVIPELKITDKGVFDTTKFKFIDIFNN